MDHSTNNLRISKEGNNVLIQGFANGASIPLEFLGITGQIKRLWTVFNVADLFNAFDATTGEKITVTLKDAKPKHHVNAFLEDSMHDYWIHQGTLRYCAHSSEVGDTVAILVELLPA